VPPPPPWWFRPSAPKPSMVTSTLHVEVIEAAKGGVTFGKSSGKAAGARSLGVATIPVATLFGACGGDGWFTLEHHTASAEDPVLAAAVRIAWCFVEGMPVTANEAIPSPSMQFSYLPSTFGSRLVRSGLTGIYSRFCIISRRG